MVNSSDCHNSSTLMKLENSNQSLAFAQQQQQQQKQQNDVNQSFMYYSNGEYLLIYLMLSKVPVITFLRQPFKEKFLIILALNIVDSAFIIRQYNNNNFVTFNTKSSSPATSNSVINDYDYWLCNFPNTDHSYMVLFLIMSNFFGVAILVYAHQNEYTYRRDFLWCQNAKEDRTRICLMRECNRFIFFNLLPPHVASYFLEQRTIRSHMVSGDRIINDFVWFCLTLVSLVTIIQQQQLKC